MKISTKNYGAVLKVIILAILIMVLFFTCICKAPAQQKKQLTWEQTRLIWEDFVTDNNRIPLEWPTEYFEKFSTPLTFEQKQEVVLLWILTTEGNYTTHILPGIKMYLELFDSEISSSENLKELFKSMLAGLRRILPTLDRQIKVHFDTQGKEGFFSEDMESMLKERSSNQFHKEERRSVMQLYGLIPSRFDDETYAKLKANFQGVLSEGFLEKY